VAVVSVSLPDKFQTREYRFVRAVVFTMLGMWGVVPVTHLLLTHGHVWAIRTAFRLDMLMGLIYLVSTADDTCSANWCCVAFCPAF
jgi:predicted membrane channel-forming protein YqfA (hemolysin III family)